jgi:hypothetical protein
MADDEDKKWWKDKEKLQPGAIGAAIGVAVCAAGILIKNKKDEKEELGRGSWSRDREPGERRRSQRVRSGGASR